MLKGLREVVWRVQNTPVVHIGDVDIEHIIGQFRLRGLNSNAPFSSHTAHGHFGDSAQKGFAGCIV
jgi:hypothetical protein